MTFRLVLFDCDGTLIDSAGVIASTMAQAFIRHDLAPPSADEVRAIIGLSLPHAVAVLAAHHPQAPVPEIAEAYKLAYRDAVTGGAHAEPLFPGIVEALDTIDGPGSVLGIVTGKSRRGLLRLLDLHGLPERFAVLKTADDAPSKPAPDMVLQAIADVGGTAGRTVVIGDTSFDMEMALAAGAQAIGVAWGYHAVDALQAAGAGAIAHAASDLPRLVDGALALPAEGTRS